MSAVLLRAREWAGRNGLRAMWVAVVIGLIAGAVLSVAAGARRTGSAPDRYTASVGGDPDLLVYQTWGPPLTEAIRGVAGVADAQGATFVAAWPKTANFEELLVPTVPFAGDARALGGRIVEGRYADQTAPDEFTVNRPLAELMGATVGDRFDIAAFNAEQSADPAFDGSGVPGVPTFQATLVGITLAVSEFEDPAPQVMYSPAMLSAHPDIGVVATIMLIDLVPGADPEVVLAAAQQLPNGEALQRATDPQYVSFDVRRAVRFVSISLWIVAGIAGTGAALVAALLATQIVGPKGNNRLALRALGWRRAEFVGESLLESVAIALGSIGVAAAVTVATSGFFPFGPSRILEPNPGITADLSVLAVGGGALLVICAGSAFINEFAWTGARVNGKRTTLGRALSGPFWTLPRVAGIRFALEPPPQRRTAWTSLAPGVVGCAGLVAAMTVGLSISQLVDEPARWGYNADAIYGNPFLPQPSDIVTPARDVAGVADLAAATVGAVTVDGTEIDVVGFELVKGSLAPATLEGRHPASADEIGLGRETARRLGVSVGDSVTATGYTEDQLVLSVVGIVMTPFDAGGGAAMTYAGYERLVPDATKNLLMVRFADGQKGEAAAALRGATGINTTLDFVILPTSVRSVDRVTPMAYLLAGILSLLGGVALVHALATSVRDRRRDFGVLRALGGAAGQLRRLLHWQATTVALVVLTLGVPVGLLIGRLIFGAVADRVGVTPQPHIAWALLPVLIAIVVMTTNAAALLPARRASRATALDLVSVRR